MVNNMVLSTTFFGLSYALDFGKWAGDRLEGDRLRTFDSVVLVDWIMWA